MTTERLRQRVEAWLLRVWFGPARPGDRLLAAAAAPLALPLSALVARIARRRRARIRRQALPPAPGEVPVVVVGNLLAGGTGKSPLVAALARGLAGRGFVPGLVARGYRGSEAGARLVGPASDPRDVGDEAVMLATATGLPMAVGVRRAEAVRRLLAARPDIDVVLADDGLQHVGLPRAVEIVVIDGRGLGNRRCLPAGPLREPADRLDRVDAIVVNGAPGADGDREGTDRPSTPRRFTSRLAATGFRSLDGTRRGPPEALAREVDGARVVAIAGIARPERFFDLLGRLGVPGERIALADHARIEAGWLAALPADRILMTAKDAVKCHAFDPALLARCLCLDVEAKPEPALLEWLVDRLRPPAADPR